MQLKAVGPVAVLGGLLQIVTFMFLCGITAMVILNFIIPSSHSILLRSNSVKSFSLLRFSYVVQSCLRVFLLVPSCQCHQLQWCVFRSFSDTAISLFYPSAKFVYATIYCFHLLLAGGKVFGRTEY